VLPPIATVILVRLLFFLAVGAIAMSGLLYLFTRDRRYLQFIGKVAKFTIILLVVVLAGFFLERLIGPLW
jgi:hypothetical protein